MAKISVNGVDYYYELHGKGKPVVFITGYTGDHTYWTLMLDAFAKNFQVLLFDNRGAGQTKDNHETLTAEIMADGTIDLINSLGLEKPHIIGQSMGGTIAQMISIKHGHAIDKLVILNSVPKWNTVTTYCFDALIKLRKAGVSLECQIDAILPWVRGYAFLKDKERMRLQREAILNNPYPQSLEDQIRQSNVLRTFDSHSQLKNIKNQTLVAYAEEDIIALPRESKELINSIEHASEALLPGGHGSPIEVPNEASKEILNFLQS